MTTAPLEIATAQEVLANGVVRECHHHFAAKPTARELGSLEIVPDPIKVKLVDHLKARLGNSFYENLHYHGGLAFNPSDVGSGGRDAKIPAYHFEFTFSMPEAGVKEYCAQIDLSSRGRVEREIDLPEVARDAKKGTIIPLTQALQTAETEGVPRESALVELGYEASSDLIVWQISYTKKDESGETVLLTLDMNAHTGQKITWHAQYLRFHKPA